jgi:hypothetical protein
VWLHCRESNGWRGLDSSWGCCYIGNSVKIKVTTHEEMGCTGLL